MKAFIFILSALLLGGLQAQAAEQKVIYLCSSKYSGPIHNGHSGPIYKVTVYEEMRSTRVNPEQPSSSYPVEVQNDKGQTIARFQGVGNLTEWKAQLTLLLGGDMAMGNLLIDVPLYPFNGELKASLFNGERLDLRLICYPGHWG